MFRWLDHTAELELYLEGADELAVFGEALRALGELLDRDPCQGEPTPMERDVVVEAPDRAALLVEWLGELVFLAETEDLVPERMGAATLRLPPAATGEPMSPARLHARVQGRRGQPRHLVKAVTYHDLSFARLEPGGPWEATCVLDV